MGPRAPVQARPPDSTRLMIVALPTIVVFFDLCSPSDQGLTPYRHLLIAIVAQTAIVSLTMIVAYPMTVALSLSTIVARLTIMAG